MGGVKAKPLSNAEVSSVVMRKTARNTRATRIEARKRFVVIYFSKIVRLALSSKPIFALKEGESYSRVEDDVLFQELENSAVVLGVSCLDQETTARSKLQGPTLARTEDLARFMDESRKLLVLTGAGCSTESGIPDYRDGNGDWKRKQPVRYQAFVANPRTRRRYWARAMIGWDQVASAVPNSAHRCLASLEEAGFVHHLITQNVDGLHQKAGSRKVIDLHGRLDVVRCLGCEARLSREDFQIELKEMNRPWQELEARYAPDGDADLEGADFERFQVPPCRRCDGILKPDVVFFGENVPRERVGRAMSKLQEADALLVVGSSLMVWSGYRFARAAAERGIPIGAVNLGKTRADEALRLKLESRCGPALTSAWERLKNRSLPEKPTTQRT
jgi:NAD-dependent SIR2 family protein deacetylase